MYNHVFIATMARSANLVEIPLRLGQRGGISRAEP